MPIGPRSIPPPQPERPPRISGDGNPNPSGRSASGSRGHHGSGVHPHGASGGAASRAYAGGRRPHHHSSRPPSGSRGPTQHGYGENRSQQQYPPKGVSYKQISS